MHDIMRLQSLFACINYKTKEIVNATYEILSAHIEPIIKIPFAHVRKELKKKETVKKKKEFNSFQPQMPLSSHTETIIFPVYRRRLIS